MVSIPTGDITATFQRTLEDGGPVAVHLRRDPPIHHGGFQNLHNLDDLDRSKPHCFRIKINKFGRYVSIAPASENFVWVRLASEDYVYTFETYSLEASICFAFYGYIQTSVRPAPKQKFQHVLHPIVNFGERWGKKMLKLRIVRSTRYGTNNGSEDGVTFFTIFMKHLQRFVDIQRVDREYLDVDIKMPEISEPLGPETVDEQVYQRFKAIMNIRSFNSTPTKWFSGRPTWKMHGIRFTEICRVHDAWKNKTPLAWDDIDGNFTYAARPRSLKKDGTVRCVYVMSPKLNAYVTQRFSGQEPRFPDNVRVISGTRFAEFNYSYDVKNCDRQLLPYFKRLLEEEAPDAVDKLLCKVSYNGKWADLSTFPSGICVFMSYITSAFTVALLDLGAAKGRVQVQGDGVTLTHPLSEDKLKFVREYPQGIVNGFYYTVYGSHYVNAVEKLNQPVFFDAYKFTGLKKWEFRRAVYQKVLDALDGDLPDVRSARWARHFGEMTGKELLTLAQREDPEMYDFATRARSGFGNGNGTTWAGVPSIGYVA